MRPVTLGADPFVMTLVLQQAAMLYIVNSEETLSDCKITYKSDTGDEARLRSVALDLTEHFSAVLGAPKDAF